MNYPKLRLETAATIAILCVWTGSAAGQQAQQDKPPDPAAERATQARETESLEPAVDTSGASPGTPSSPPAAPVVPAAAAPQVTPAPRAAPAEQAPAAEQSRPAQRSQRAIDRIELDATQVTGNSELPKVLYIVPWKRSDLGDLTGRPVNSLLDEVLTPIDRDVFRRENRYYDALRPDEASKPAGDER